MVLVTTKIRKKQIDIHFDELFAKRGSPSTLMCQNACKDSGDRGTNRIRQELGFCNNKKGTEWK